MKNIIYLFVLLSLLNLSCSDDNNTVNTGIITPNVEVESSTIKVGCEIEKICSQACTYMILVYRNQPLPVSACPTVTLDNQSKKITVDYGSAPCISNVDSVRISGKYVINYYTNVSSDSIAGKITFTDFRIYKTNNVNDTSYLKISGDDDIGGKKLDSLNYKVTYVMNNNFYRDNGSNGNAILNLSVNANTGSLSNLSDDIFTITGSGTIINSGVSYSYNIFDNTKPIMIYGDCKYPKSGLIKLTSGNGDVIIDFYPNSGACDAIISVLKNNIQVIVDLASRN
ncbi:MAG: hypothetical protein HY959_07665 [Ignavibacteriae bacterium]|nr:hypothetical protein [Ignavibacteriota bacterium]